MCVDEDAAHVHGAVMDPSATLVAVTVPVTQMIVTAGSVQAPPSIDPSAVPRAPDKFTVTFATTVANGANIVIEDLPPFSGQCLNATMQPTTS